MKPNKQRFGGLFVKIAIILTLLILLGMGLKRLYKKFKHTKPAKIILIIVGIILLSQAYLFYYKVEHSCDRWYDGLSQKLDNSDKYCQFGEPEYCFAEIQNGLLDLSKYLDDIVNCKY